jgi:flavodoxin I
MKTLIIYDSLYGATEKIARAMGEALGQDARTEKIDRVKTADLAGFGLVIIGSPTQGGKTSPPMQAFLENLPENTFQGKNVAVFDTRLKLFFVPVFGFAALKMQKTLQTMGAQIITPPEGFYVTTGKTPIILAGEIERAVSWAKAVVAGT